MSNKVTIYTKDGDVIVKNNCDDEVTTALENMPFETNHVTAVSVQTGQSE